MPGHKKLIPVAQVDVKELVREALIGLQTCITIYSQQFPTLRTVLVDAVRALEELEKQTKELETARNILARVLQENEVLKSDLNQTKGA